MTAPTTAAPQAPASRGVTRQDVFSVLGALGALLTLVGAVMFYFGWRRADVQAQAMSIDVSLFGFTSQDYVLRSISSLYQPLLAIFGLVLGWLWLHSYVVKTVGSERLADGATRHRAGVWTGRVARAAAAVAVATVLFTIAAGFRSPPWPVGPLYRNAIQARQWVLPLILIVATLSAAYAWWIHRRLAPASEPPEARALWQTVLPAMLVASTVVLGGFWMLEEYASAVGRGYASRVIEGVDRLARVVVVSPAPLGIEAADVEETRLGAADDPGVRYRTTGLRFLARSGGKVLLVHDDWTPSTGTVVVLADSDELTWQFSR